MKVKVKWCESLVQHKGAENAPPFSKPLQSADAVLAVGGISRGSRREGKGEKIRRGKGSELQKRPGRTLQVRNTQQATCNTWNLFKFPDGTPGTGFKSYTHLKYRCLEVNWKL